MKVDDGGELRASDGPEMIVRQPRVALRVNVRDHPLAKLSELTWKLDGEPEKKLDLDRPDKDPFVELLPKLERGKPRVVVITAWTREPPGVPSRSFPKTLTINFKPGPPRIDYKGERNLTVKGSFFDLRAKVFPAFAGEDVLITVRHSHGGKVLSEKPSTATIAPDKSLDIDERLELRDGSNLVEVIAVNRARTARRRGGKGSTAETRGHPNQEGPSADHCAQQANTA